MAHLAIDLGTTTTMAAIYTRDGGGEGPVVLQVDDCERIPSVICMPPDQIPIVGRAALDRWVQGADATGVCYRRWKMHLGRESGNAYVSSIDPQRLTTIMVEYILRSITGGLGGIQGIDSVQITVPHGWRRDHPEWCVMLRNAAASAQLDGKLVNVREEAVSEPVAAAVYWMWEASRSQPDLFDSLKGQHMLVCDMGGGTFDLSLVHIRDRSILEVVDASNTEFAGDFATALLCAEVSRQLGDAAQGVPWTTVLLASERDVLARLDHPADAWLREWFAQAEEMIHRLSLAEENRRPNIPPLLIKKTFQAPDGQSHRRVEMNGEHLKTCLNPFYQQAKAHVKNFIERLDLKRLAAVTFAGGGSRIIGLRDAAQAGLVEIMGQARAQDVCTKVPVNSQRMDQAVVLGAALIAEGVVAVEEKLLYQIGIIITIQGDVANRLKLPNNTRVILMPVIPRLSSLPAQWKGENLGFNIEAVEKLRLELIVEDESRNARSLIWEPDCPWNPGRVAVDVTLQVDRNGMITLTADSHAGGAPLLVKGKLSAAHGDVAEGTPRIDQERLMAALAKVGS